jgi:hypothetical protein
MREGVLQLGEKGRAGDKEEHEEEVGPRQLPEVLGIQAERDASGQLLLVRGPLAEPAEPRVLREGGVLVGGALPLPQPAGVSRRGVGEGVRGVESAEGWGGKIRRGRRRA